MPLYTFQSESGQTIDLQYSMAQAPTIGSIVNRGGVAYRRVADFQIDAGVHAKVNQYPYVSNVLPRNLKGVGGYDRNGKPVIRSRLHEREVCAMHGYERD